MKRTINGYPYDLPNVEDVRETHPGHWEGTTLKGDPFWVIGGTRVAYGSRQKWLAIFPKGFKGVEPRPEPSLAHALRDVNEMAANSGGNRRSRVVAEAA